MKEKRAHERQLFHSFTGNKFEWRFWGNLEQSAGQLAELWPVLTENWDEQVMSADGSLSVGCIRIISRCVKDDADDLAGVEQVLAAAWVLSAAVGFSARWARGCRCHEELDIENPTYVKRRHLMRETDAAETDGICMW